MTGQRKDKMELRTLILFKKKGLSNRKLAQMMNINRKTVDSYISRFKLLKLDSSELLSMDDEKLHDLFAEKIRQKRSVTKAYPLSYVKFRMNSNARELPYR